MTILENVDLCDAQYAEIREISSAQKIKLRAPSYTAIVSKYSAFSNANSALVQSTEENTSTPVYQDAQVVMVTAINPKVAAMIQLLDIHGKIASEGYKALKIKPAMQANIEINSQSSSLQSITTENDISSMPAEEEISIDSNDMINSPQLDMQMPKVSQNASSIARIEKYSSEEISDEYSAQTESKPTISPTTIEEQSLRPVSRETPIIVPERSYIEQEKNMTIEHQDKNEAQPSLNILDIVDNITSLDALKEYLAEIANLQHQAEEARNKAEEAKKSAEIAEAEAEDSKIQLKETARRVAEHQERLIAQTEQSNEQASIYDARRDEYVNERNEYQRAINDMLQMIGDSPIQTKGREK